jgi:hypothetical protein
MDDARHEESNAMSTATAEAGEGRAGHGETESFRTLWREESPCRATPPLRPRTRRPRRGRDVLVPFALSFAAAFALLDPWSRGPAPAGADDPAATPVDPRPVVDGFAPALADGEVHAARPTPIGGATVQAWLGRNDAGASSIVVELRGARDGKTSVRCRVALQLVKFPDSSPMMRLLPPPEISELLAQDVEQALGPGEVRRIAIPVPADRLPPPPEGGAPSMTHGQLVVEALGDA